MSKTYKILYNLINHAIDPVLRKRIWQWLVTPSNQKEKEEALFSLWNEISTEADSKTYHSYEATQIKIRQKQKTRKPYHITHRLLRIAAILIIPLLSVVATRYYMQRNPVETEMIQCFVPEGEKQEIILPDGSKVNINSGSTLLYPDKFDGKIRSVYLMGEAYFSIEEDKNHPFVVNTNYLKIQVLGTKFNVEAYNESDKIITTLESGAVEVNKLQDHNTSFILSPNDQLEYNYRTDKFEKRKINAENYSEWTEEKLYFINQPLQEILATIQREYAVKFVIDPHLFTSDFYTIKFTQKEDIESTMKILSLTVGNIDYKIEDNVITINTLKKKGAI